MKYNLVISRTYVTQIKVVADSKEDAWDWINQNSDFIYEQEMEQCNVISEETDLKEDTPSLNEAEELLDLAGHITEYLAKYRHVEDYIPSDMFKALEQMRSHINDED